MRDPLNNVIPSLKLENCGTAMTANRFTVDGHAYTINELRINIGGGAHEVTFKLNRTVRTNFLPHLVLYLDGERYGWEDLRDGVTANSDSLTWRDLTQRLTDGQRVQVRLVHNPAPPPVRNLGVSARTGALDLSWITSPVPTTGYDVHYTSVLHRGVVPDTWPALNNPLGNKPVAGWVPLSRSGTQPGSSNPTYTISSLPSGTAYRVRVRARNSAGVSDWVFGTGTTSGTAPVVVVPAPAKPQNTIWSTTLTVAQHTGVNVEFGCDNGSSQMTSCSDALASPNFPYEGYTVFVGEIEYNSSINRLEVGFNELGVSSNSRGLGSNWRRLTLHFGDKSFPFADGQEISAGHVWRFSSVQLGWSAGQQVQVRLTYTPPPPPTVLLSASPNPVREGSPVTVTATLSGALSEDVRIPVYSAAAGSFDITIPAGQTTGTHEFTAPQLEDGEMKQFQIAIEWWRILKSTSLSPKGSQSIAGVTVLDENADPHRVSVSDASGTEMANGYPRLCFAFTLDRAASHLIWVGYRTENGTATAGQDYQGVIGSPVIPFEPGETYKRKCISILDDNVEDSGETFSMVLVNPEGAILGRARGTGTIYNHEPTSLSALTAEGASGENGPFTALDIGSFAPATTAYAVTVPHGTTHVRLTPKSLNRYLTITTGLDGKKKSQVPFGGGIGPAVALAVGENVLVVKTLLASGQRQTYRVTVTRQAAPAAVEVTLSATPNPVQEGSPVTVRATLATALAQAVTIPLTVTRGTSEDGDHGSLASIEIPAGGTSATGTITTTDDADGDDETFTVALGTLPSGLTAGTASSVEVTITDKGAQQQRTEPLTAAFENVPSEHDGTAFSFDLTLSEAPGAGNLPVAASFKVAPGKASVSGSGTRYTVTVTPKAANAWKDVTITLAGGRACSEEGAVCTADGRALSNTSTTTVGGPVRIRIEGARAKEGKDETLDFAVTLNRAAAHDVSVDYATKDETATAGADYTATSGTLTFAAGETAKTVKVPVLDDAVDEGKEVMRLLLSNPQGAYLRGVHAKAKGVIRNDDALQKLWLSRFGRTVATQTVAALEGRFAVQADAPSHVTMAGVDLLSAAGDDAALGETLTGLAQAFGAPSAPAGDNGPFAKNGRSGLWDDPGSRSGAGSVASAPARGMTARGLLAGSSFRFTTGGALDPGGAMTGWGKVVSGGSDGSSLAGLSYASETATGILGMDWERNRLLVGVALSRSLETGRAQEASGTRYDIEGELSTVAPYMRVQASERLSFWSALGSGEGSMALSWGGVSQKADITMQLVAAGGRAELLRPEAGDSGFALALKGDAFFVRTESARVSAPGVGNLAASTGDASRVRAVLEGSQSFGLGGGGSLEPSLSLGLRHDGGDAETGTGVEAGMGLAWSDPSRGLTSDLRLYGLAAHESGGYEEWGASGSLRLVPDPSGRGLSLSMTPSWGAQGQTGRLWDTAPKSFAGTDDSEAPGGRLDTEVGYGLSALGGTGTPYAGLGLGDSGARDWRLGWRFTSGRLHSLSLGVEATRREAANDNGAEHGVTVRGALRW